MPTAYPKAAPNQVIGLLVLLNDHKGAEDVARLADDLNLEIDEIVPSLEYAAVLQLVSVTDGRASLTDVGRRLLAGSIRGRKTALREQLKKTALFRTLLAALESSPQHRLTDDEVLRLIEFTSAPADSLVQNIINWGRYAELFRYDSAAHALLPARTHASSPPPAPPPPPAAPPAGAMEQGMTPPPVRPRRLKSPPADEKAPPGATVPA